MDIKFPKKNIIFSEGREINGVFYSYDVYQIKVDRFYVMTYIGNAQDTAEGPWDLLEAALDFVFTEIANKIDGY